MIFDRHLPSCYTSTDFRDMVEEIGGHYVVAGQFAELACLSTAIDAFHRDHHPVFLSDALVVRGGSDLPPELMRKSLISILSLYSNVARTQPWITQSRSVGVPI
jgi:isochorismate hydrolase